MLKRVILFVHLLLFVTGSFSSVASAKKKFALLRFKTESVVKVMDLPDLPQLRTANGRYIDLGYKFNPTGGDWVGYIGRDDRYIKLDQKALQAMLTVAGLKKPPRVPERPAGSKLRVFLFLVGIGMGAFFVLLYLIFLVIKIRKHFFRPKPVANPFAELLEDVRQRSAQSGSGMTGRAGLGSANPAAGPARASFGKRQS